MQQISNSTELQTILNYKLEKGLIPSPLYLINPVSMSRYLIVHGA